MATSLALTAYTPSTATSRAPGTMTSYSSSSALATSAGGKGGSMSLGSLAPVTAIAGTSAYDDAVKEFVDVLEVHMKNAEKLGRYAEADIARQRWMELKEHEIFRRKETIRSKHLAELLGLEEAYVLEFHEFHLIWAQKEREFEERSAAILAELQAKHDAALRAFQQKLLIRSAYPRHSRDYFNMRKIEEYLAKNKNYIEAAAMREKADALELKEEEKWNIERQEEQLLKESGFKSKQQVELDAVRNKIVMQRAALSRDRQKALEHLLMRYGNARSELERGQKHERTAFEKEVQQELKSIKGHAHKLAY